MANISWSLSDCRSRRFRETQNLLSQALDSLIGLPKFLVDLPAFFIGLPAFFIGLPAFLIGLPALFIGLSLQIIQTPLQCFPLSAFSGEHDVTPDGSPPPAMAALANILVKASKLTYRASVDRLQLVFFSQPSVHGSVVPYQIAQLMPKSNTGKHQWQPYKFPEFA